MATSKSLDGDLDVYVAPSLDERNKKKRKVRYAVRSRPPPPPSVVDDNFSVNDSPAGGCNEVPLSPDSAESAAPFSLSLDDNLSPALTDCCTLPADVVHDYTPSSPSGTPLILSLFFSSLDDHVIHVPTPPLVYPPLSRGNSPPLPPFTLPLPEYTQPSPEYTPISPECTQIAPDYTLWSPSAHSPSLPVVNACKKENMNGNNALLASLPPCDV